MKKRNLIAPSILAMLMSASLIGGATYSLFTSESTHDITVSSGNIDVASKIDTESIKTTSLGIENLPLKDTFANGGKISILEGKNIVLDKMTPGDKATFTVNVTNNSNVDINIRTKLSPIEGYELYGGLKIDYGSYLNWQKVEYSPDNAIIDIPITIELPEEIGNEYKNLSTKMTFGIEVIQGNATVVDSKITDTKTNDEVKVNFNNVLTENVNLKSKNGAVKASFLKENASTEATEATLTVKAPLEEEKANFNVEDGESAVYYDIDVKGADTSVSPVDVSLYAGKDLYNVSVQHNKVDGVEIIENSVYDPNTGYVTFKTNSFSAFAIIASKVRFVPANGTPEENGAALTSAVSKSKKNTVILLTKGEYITNGTYNGVEATRDMTIIGAGSKTVVKYTKKPNAIFYAKDCTLTVKNLNVYSEYETLANNPEDGLFQTWGTYKGAMVLDNLSYSIHKADSKAKIGYNPIKFTIGNEGEFLNLFNPAQIVYEVSPKVYKCIWSRAAVLKLKDVKNYTLNHDIYLTAAIADDNENASSVNFGDSSIKGANCTINLNNHAIRFAYSNVILEKFDETINEEGHSMFYISHDSTLNFTGEGLVDASMGKLNTFVATIGVADSYPSVGHLVINGGNYIAGVVCYNANGTVEINGGHFELSDGFKNPENPAEPNIFLLNCKDASFTNGKAKYFVKGGEFVNFNPADVKSEPTNPVSFLADGYESTLTTLPTGENVYTVAVKATIA